MRFGAAVAVGVVVLAACRPAAQPPQSPDDAQRALDAQARREADARDAERERASQAAALADAEASRERLATFNAQAEHAAEAAEQDRQRAVRKAFEEQEKLRADCAADRPAREQMRKMADARRVADEAKRAKGEERAAYLAKHCKKRERAVEGLSDRLCTDDEGVLRRCPGIFGVEIVFDCPANGPPGLRGEVVAGQVLNGQDPSRVARSARFTTPTRDEKCAEADAAAASVR